MEWSKRLVLLIACLLCSPRYGRPPAAQAPGVGMAVQQLRPSIHVVSGYENGNVLVLESDSGVLLIDAQSTKRVVALDSAVRRISSRPVRMVINTHYHGDHTEGNAFYRSRGAEVVAHRSVRLQGSKDTVITSWDNWHRTPLAALSIPTREFDDSLSFDFGAERVTVLHAPRAHTDGDAIIWFARANVLHIGDIFEVGAPPFIDWWVGGSLAGMIRAVDRVLAMVNDQTAIVPGHGVVSTRADLARYRTMMATIGARVDSAIAAGTSVDAVVAGQPAREWEQSLGGARRVEHFVRLLYAGATMARR